MTFIHEHREFAAVLRAAAASSVLGNEALVEKDYWVTHALWALSNTGLTFWFKGGTSLSKAFMLTSRFSEDLDLVVAPGQVAGLPSVSSWQSDSIAATASRRAYWEAITPHLVIPNVSVTLQVTADETYRNPPFRAQYPGLHLESLSQPASVVSPFVLLELANADMHAAVAPSVARPISSILHEYLATQDAFDGPGAVIDNRPTAVQCVHPVVTLLEKLDAITRRYDRPDARFEPRVFVRHYEDAARIILALEAHTLPPIAGSVADVAAQLLAAKHIRQLVVAEHPALHLSDTTRREQVERAYATIASMFWSAQMPLAEARSIIVGWLASAPMAT